MAIELVGIQSFGDAGTTTPFGANSWSLSGGLASVPSAGDYMVFIACAANGVDFGWGNNYTAQGLSVIYDLYANDTYDTNLGVYVGFFVSADLGWPHPYSNSTAAACSGAIAVFRGVDPNTPFDVSSVSATGLDTGVPSSPSITPVTRGAIPVFCVAASGAATTPVAFTNGSLSGLVSSAGNDDRDAYTAIGYTSWTSGAASSGTWSNGPGTSTSNSWAAVTLALRPKQGRVRYWGGSSFSAKPVKVWNGSAWVEKPVKFWNGSAWVKTNW